jgi:hypothetical protein
MMKITEEMRPNTVATSALDILRVPGSGFFAVHTKTRLQCGNGYHILLGSSECGLLNMV